LLFYFRHYYCYYYPDIITLFIIKKKRNFTKKESELNGIEKMNKWNLKKRVLILVIKTTQYITIRTYRHRRQKNRSTICMIFLVYELAKLYFANAPVTVIYVFCTFPYMFFVCIFVRTLVCVCRLGRMVVLVSNFSP